MQSIERNSVRAGLTNSPFVWEWSGEGPKKGGSVPLQDWPLPKPEKWNEFLRWGADPLEEARIREALLRGSVLNRSQIKPLGRCRGRSFTTRTGKQDLFEFREGQTPLADFDKGTHEIPDHPVEEAIALKY